MKIRMLSCAGILSALLILPTSPSFTRANAQNVAPVNSPEADLADYRLNNLEEQLEGCPAGPERDYFGGLLANRRGQDERSIELLTRASVPAARSARCQSVYCA